MKTQREFALGLIRIHVLLHASREPIFGLAMIRELRHHGYKIGPGTLYPLLHGMESAGLLLSRETVEDGHARRIYRITEPGQTVLADVRAKIDELHRELHEEPLHTIVENGAENGAEIE
jgi:DNA-binding PadR family transcriptional regulator